METKRFSKLDSGFVCENCGKQVTPLGYTSRNHCPYCLHSKHVDINPGDRMNDCGGLLVPVQSLPDAKKGFIIVFKCKKCGQTVRNVAALGKTDTPDNSSLLIRLTNPER
ncbi:MAG: RNHCP domain-containing protein [Clostridia bacterium]|nr:RNHCP domain-containing protein [Clostridia bacterium]